MKQGWIKLYRSILDNEFWQEKRTFSRGEAWIDLLLMVNHEERNVLVGNQTIIVKPGERLTSIAKLAERWDWSRKKVTNFLNLLQEQQMVSYKSTSKYTVVTVLKWDFYQNDIPIEEHQKNISGTSKEHQKHTNKNEKNEKNEKINSPDLGGRTCAYGTDTQAMSLEVGAVQTADDRPTHSIDIVYYRHYPTTEHEMVRIRAFAAQLFADYRRKPACEADVERVFEYVHRRAELSNDAAIAVFDPERAALLEYAFRQGLDGGDTSWNYINGIYNNFAKRGIKTVYDAERYEFKRKTGKTAATLAG